MTNPLERLTSHYLTKKALPYWYIIIIDCMIIFTAGMVSTYISNGANGLVHHFWHYVRTWIFVTPLFMIGMKCFHTYSGVLRYTTTIDFVKIFMSQVIGGMLLLILKYIMMDNGSIIANLRIMQICTMLVLSITGQWGIRIALRYAYEASISDKKTKRVFIYGAREGGVAIARSIKNNPLSEYKVVGFVSTDGSLASKYVFGIKVRKDGDNLIHHMKKEDAKTLIISPIQVEHFRKNEKLVQQLIEEGIKIIMMRDPQTWDPNKQIKHQQLREVDIEDLLPRDKIDVDMQSIGIMLQNKRILITGAAGSIGSEMVRQISRFDPKELVLIDQAETPMHDVRLYMAKQHPEIKCRTIVASISNPTHMEEIFKTHTPEYVFHAAAYKHVPMMEDNPAMAIQNNTYGTRVIADLAVKYGTKKFVMISTDKAVNPTNVMGCSKRICEIYCQSLNQAIADGEIKGCTQFITTRFGNVLGSNGSVIPIFREQIKKGGPVTVTHPDIIRFFMLIPEACQLVLEAGTMGKGGEIFVFDMGKPVRIADLAKRMIALSGARDIEIKYTGLRDGEKLYEEVLNDEEQTKPTHHPKIKIASVREYPYEKALNDEKELYELSFTYDDMAIVKKMKEIVPEYKSQHSKYEELDK